MVFWNHATASFIFYQMAWPPQNLISSTLHYSLPNCDYHCSTITLLGLLYNGNSTVFIIVHFDHLEKNMSLVPSLF